MPTALFVVGTAGLAVSIRIFATSKLLRRLESSVRHRLGIPAPWVRRTLAGRDLLVRDGSFVDAPDYDDAWVFACAQRASVVFDVGANVGQSAMLVLLAPSVTQVVLVEANAEALAVAADHLIKNRFSTRARFVAAFASDAANATVQLWTVGTGAAGSMYPGHADAAARAHAYVDVPTTTLDELSTAFGIVPDLVKIDVEGAEAKVLEGSRGIARASRTRFLVEMHAPRELPMIDNASMILRWAASVGYSAWYLSEGTRLDSPEKIQHRGRCHLLLQPSGWEYPAWLTGIQQAAPPGPVL